MLRLLFKLTYWRGQCASDSLPLFFLNERTGGDSVLLIQNRLWCSMLKRRYNLYVCLCVCVVHVCTFLSSAASAQSVIANNQVIQCQAVERLTLSEIVMQSVSILDKYYRIKWVWMFKLQYINCKECKGLKAMQWSIFGTGTHNCWWPQGHHWVNCLNSYCYRTVTLALNVYF